MHRKTWQKNKHDADHTSALASHTTFSHHFCQKMQLEELLGNVNRTAETEEDADMLFALSQRR